MIEKREFFLKQFLFVGVTIFCFGAIKYSVALLDGGFYFEPIDLILFFIGLSIFMLKSGFRLNNEKKTLTRFIKFYGLTVWNEKVTLPDRIDYILLTAGRYYNNVYLSKVKPTKQKLVLYDVQLVFDERTKRKKIFQLKKKQAIKYGQVLADFYSVDIKI